MVCLWIAGKSTGGGQQESRACEMLKSIMHKMKNLKELRKKLCVAKKNVALAKYLNQSYWDFE